MKKSFQKLFLLMAFVVLGAAKMSAAEAYAVYNNGTLTFYYDTQSTSRTGTVYSLNTDNNEPGWYNDGTNTSVTSVVFDDSFSSARPTSTRSWFRGMKNLTSITNLDKLNTSQVTSMYIMFSNCSKLTSLDVTTFDTRNVTNMQAMFHSLSGLTSLDLSNFNTEKVTVMYSMFYGCSALTTLDIRTFNTSEVTNMSNMFANCTNLTTIYVGHGWSTAKVTQGGSVFASCTRLVGGEGTTYNSNNVTASYAHVDGGTSNPGYFTRVPYAVYTSSNKTLTFYDDGNANAKTGTIYNLNTGARAPEWKDVRNNIYTVVFSESFSDARPTTTYSWFGSLGNLTAINNINNLNTSAVTDMRYMFQNCYGLTTLDLSSWNTENVTVMNGMFQSCHNLTTLDLTGWNTAKVTNMAVMFNDCRVLTTIYVNLNWSTAAVTISTSMFSGCSNLVGGNGTAYNSSYLNKTYARIDKSGQPGYLTMKPEAYAVYTSANGGFTFYYDTNRSEQQGETILIDETADNPLGSDQSFRSSVSHVLFDPSFADYRPKSLRNWFRGMTNLAAVNGIQYLNTSEADDMAMMFYQCRSLTSIDLSSFDTSNVLVLGYMFYGCSALTSLDLSNFNTSKVLDTTGMFRNCGALETIYVGSGWNMNSVNSHTYMFTSCTSLVGGAGTTFNSNYTNKTYAHVDGGTSNPGYFTNASAREAYVVYDNGGLTFYCDAKRSSRPGVSYNLNTGYNRPEWLTGASNVTFDPSFANARPTSTYCWFSYMENIEAINGIQYLNTSEVTNMSGMFEGCNNLIYLDVSGFDTGKVTDMGSMFHNCQKVKYLNVGNWNTSSVTNMGDLFNTCYVVEWLDVSGWDTHNVTNMHGFFASCQELTALDVSGFDTGKTVSMNAMFFGCSNVTSLDVSHFDTSHLGINGMDYMFDGCASLTSLDLSSFITSGLKSLVCTFSNCSSLTSLDVSGFDVSNMLELYGTFQYCSSLTSLDVTNWDTGNCTNMMDLFRGCESLTSLDVTNFNTSNVMKMSNMFSWCKSLTSLNVTHLNTSKVEEFSQMFYGCENLQCLDVSTFDTQKAKYMNGMFGNCKQLRTLDLTNFNTKKVTNMEGMFLQCEKLTNIIFGDNFKTSLVKDMDRMFNSCKAMTSIDLSGFETGNVMEMSSMFGRCTSLKSIDLSNFNTRRVRDMSSMFDGCSSLVVIDVTSFTTDSLEQTKSIFANCPSLTTIYANDWDLSNCYDKMMMFTNDTKLVGEKGSHYTYTQEDFFFDDYIFAHVDGGTSNPGVFSNKPYAVFASNELTFYADDKRASRSGVKFDLNREYSCPDWIGYSSYIETVTFDPSFAKVRPFNTDNWFYTLNNLHTINGIENLNTSEVTNMSCMFGICSSLTSLDLSHFDTHNVTDMNCMFFNSNNLTTIFVGEGWDVSGVADSDRMFDSCSSLVGGNGTTYDASHTDKEYACIDGVDGFVGYLTGAEIYAVYTSNDNTLTFYFDGQRSTRAGVALLPHSETSGSDYPEWHDWNYNIHHAVFDPSFAQARPQQTDYWFLEMANLEDISGLKYLNTSEAMSMSNMFYACSKLESIDVSGFDTSFAMNLGGMFGYCSSLTSIDVSNFDMSHVTNATSMFFGCSSLTTIKGINEWNTPVLERTGGMFGQCSSLTTLDLSGLDTHNVEDIVQMFFGCSSLTSLKLNNWNTQNIRSMQMAFRDCSSLTSLDLSGWNTQHVTNMEEMFLQCTSLRSIYVGDGWSTSSVTSDDGMFYGCTSLVGGAGTTFSSSHVDKSYAHVDGGTSNPGYLTLRQAYACLNSETNTLTFCYDDQRSTRPGIKYDLGTGENPTWWGVANFVATRVVFEPSFADARPTCLSNWFCGMSITEVEGIEYLNTSQVTNMMFMFSECSQLQSLDVSGWDVSRVKNMYGLFNDCSQLENVDVSAWNTENVEDMQQVFYGCSSLTVIDLENWSTAKTTSAAWMFAGCTNLTTIYVSDKWTLTTDFNDMFTNCTNLVGGAGTTYDASHVDGSYAHVDGGTENPGYLTYKPQMYAVFSNTEGRLTFYYDTMKPSRKGIVYELNKGTEDPGWQTDGTYEQVRYVTFDYSFIEARPTTMYRWFAGMTQLSSINNLSMLNTSAVTDMSFAFMRCTNLTRLILSSWNTENVTNMRSMFQECTSLVELNLSGWNTENVTDMTTMFATCSALTTIWISPSWSIASQMWLDNRMFSGCTNLVGGAGTVYDPNHTDDSYAHVDVGADNPGYLSMKAYTVYDFDNKTLTFYCDGLNNYQTHPGNSSELNKDMNQPNWSWITEMEKVVFDPSFVNARPTTTYMWFYGMSNLSEIIGMEYLNTSEVENMISMFEGCSSLETIDISSFTTEKLKWITQMFNQCTNLTTIYASEGWTLQNAAGEQVIGSLIFGADEKLKGGAGTTYSGEHNDEGYAHIDGGSSNPGYFTLKPAFKKGDVNGDGAVNVSDVTMLVSMILGNTPQNAAADVNEDTQVNVTDVTALVSIILGQ